MGNKPRSRGGAVASKAVHLYRWLITSVFTSRPRRHFIGTCFFAIDACPAGSRRIINLTFEEFGHKTR